MKDLPPLRPLHAKEILSSAKLAMFEKRESSTLIDSLTPGSEHSLKARPDGTMLDGNHRIHVLRGRGVAVDALPRETMLPDLERFP